MDNNDELKQFVYTILISNWSKGDGIMTLTLMEIAEEIVDKLVDKYKIEKKNG